MNKLQKQYINEIKKLGGKDDKSLTLDLVRHIQAYGPEGAKEDILLTSLLSGQAVNTTFPGTTNGYRSYETQLKAIYRKYNGRDEFGNQQLRTVIDLRTAFIAGEGLNVSAKDDSTRDWIEKFVKANHLNGSMLSNAVKGTEMAGHTVFTYSYDDTLKTAKIHRLPCDPLSPYQPIYTNPETKEQVLAIGKKDKVTKKLTAIVKSNFVYVRTGGDDFNTYGPTTRSGIALTDIENYDRAIKDMRRINQIMARITPTFHADNEKAVKEINAKLSERKWKAGQAIASMAKFSYETPGTGAHDNLLAEVTTTAKTISAITAVPVHWLGFVDLMSNRSTADSLYELLKNGTSNERLAWEDAMYDLILKSMILAIDNGELIKLDPDFSVRLPLLDLSNFKEKVDALSIAYHDEAISMDDYRNALPGIDPIKTQKAIESEDNDAMDEIMTRPRLKKGENENGTE